MTKSKQKVCDLKLLILLKYLISITVFSVVSSVQAMPVNIASNLPDTCRTQLYSSAQKISSYTTSFGTEVHLFASEEVLDAFNTGKAPVVLLINGNKMYASSYIDLVLHLANNGYFVVHVDREGGNNATIEQSVDILDVLDDIYSTYQIDSGSPLGVIGHSVGGGIAMEVAKLNQTKTKAYNLRALITLAPNADIMFERNAPITSMEAPSYLSLYGSMDNDVKGYNDTYEAFAAYDYIGNESSTFENDNAEGEIFKSMLYIHGADHKGLVGDDSPDNQFLLDQEYISTQDQFCITKAYVTSFLNWQMLNQTNVQELFKPPYSIPQSVSIMSTSSSDYMDLIAEANPAGSPLRMFFQTSPEVKSVIQSFNSLTDFEHHLMDGSLVISSLIDGLVLGKEMFKDSPFFIRNHTNKLLLSWQSGGWDNPGNQYLAVKVPPENQDASDFSHFSLRIGQLHNEELLQNGELISNPAGEYQKIMLVIKDGNGAEAWVHLNEWGDIPFNDAKDTITNGNIVKAHTALNTISVPLDVFDRKIDLTDIRYVGLVFHEGSTGTIILDNFEWVLY